VSFDTKIRRNITSKVNDLFAVKRSSSNEKKDIQKGLPINSDEESSLVDKVIEPLARRSQISNLELVKDLEEMVKFPKNSS